MRHRHLLIASVICLGVVPAIVLAGNPPARPSGSAAPAAPADPPTVGSLASFLEANPSNHDSFRFGSTHVDVVNLHNKSGGVFDKDYDPQLAKMQPGVAMQAVEAERESKKASLNGTYTEFKDTPQGYDRTGIKDEYTYKNHESLMYVDRGGKRRYFFFMGAPPGERLWKIYDEVPLKDGGAWGKTFAEAVTKMQVQLQTPGRFRNADPSIGLSYPTVDWQDGTTHLRLVDRTADPTGTAIVGIVIEDRGTLGALATLRANKPDDPLAIDPSIAAVTRGVGRVDPNAARASASASAGRAPQKK